MSFESQAVRNSWATLVKAVAFDVLLAFGVASLNSSSDAFWITFGLVLGVIWILPLLFGWKGALYKYIFYRLEKRGRINDMKHEFRKSKLPLSDNWFKDASAYFSEVAGNDKNPKSARIFSAEANGELGVIPRYSSVDAIITHAVIEAALSEYFDEIRRDKTRYGLGDDADTYGLNGDDTGEN